MKLLKVIAVCGLASTIHAGELILNGSFEETKGEAWLPKLAPNVRDWYGGTVEAPFDDWAFGAGWEQGNYSIARSNQAHEGLCSCQIVCAKKGRGGIASSPLQLAPGTTIEVSCWIKAIGADGGRIFLNFEGAPGDGWGSKDLKTGTYEWTRFSHRVVIPNGNLDAPQSIVVFLYTSCEGTIWVDDFSVQPVDLKGPAEVGPARRKPKLIAEPADSAGYRVNVVPALEKVFREGDFVAVPRSAIELGAARNEYESMQVVIEAPWRAVTIRQVRISDLKGPHDAVIPASTAKWERVDYITTIATPPYFTEHGLGSYPDPLMPAGPFTVEKLARTPIWITLKTPKQCPPGNYSGTITITPEAQSPTIIPVTLTIWDFALTDQTHLRTLTWLGGGSLRGWYGLGDSPEDEQKQAEALGNYQDCLLEHRLGPGGEIAGQVRPDENGKFDFSDVDVKLERLIAKGMNAFIMGTAPNLAREKKSAYTPQFTQQFSGMIRAYGDHLDKKGWLDLAYVYVYDEAPKSAWPEVRKIDDAIHAAAPRVRILQCLNEPEGVRELTGFADVFDVYVAQYHKTGVAQAQKKGAEAWLAVCAYPMDHPNFFIEYPLLDLRVSPLICWKYKVNGFEYWSANSWGVNGQKKDGKWPDAPWVANTFGRYNGDGYLLYPGADLNPRSSIRLEALRDGLEDYEYLWTLNTLLEQAGRQNISGPVVEGARRLLSLDGLVNETGTYSTQLDLYLIHRRNLAEAIVTLRKLME
ncbi:MAG: hypothetical protein JWL59_970 [Chthoniobacteraceae bacterium]|nr:hypothetical protein [Chthoniobacteraceae bacterium]